MKIEEVQSYYYITMPNLSSYSLTQYTISYTLINLNYVIVNELVDLTLSSTSRGRKSPQHFICILNIFIFY